ncbi:hypothetical protein PCL_01917 [Purpureocillium lilacinum]|uniref:Uncharacterized protein n=1 Tax=Purpureocillium lilacinum TaxID=33203 RepID=A0A2U3DNZ6_PURLI|nr:hypothetical protein PCL_01917 [Purpureocillium lilacinum]
MASAFADDALPPEGVYDSREALFKAINEWAKPRGYAFTTGKSSKTPNGRVKIVYACDRNRLPPSHAVERVRRTASRKTGCKFSVLAKESLDRSTWTLGHRPDKECAPRATSERIFIIIRIPSRPNEIYITGLPRQKETFGKDRAASKHWLISYATKAFGAESDWMPTIA